MDREELRIFDLPEDSEAALTERLATRTQSAGARLVQDELRGRVQAAIEELPPRDREVLVLRYLEQLSTVEIASVLGIGEAAVKTRHRRALERLRKQLDVEAGGESE